MSPTIRRTDNQIQAAEEVAVVARAIQKAKNLLPILIKLLMGSDKAAVMERDSLVQVTTAAVIRTTM